MPFLREAQVFFQLVPHMPTRPEVAFHLNVSCTGGIDLKARPLLRIRYGSEDDGNMLAKGAGRNLTHTRSVHMSMRSEIAFHLRLRGQVDRDLRARCLSFAKRSSFCYWFPICPRARRSRSIFSSSVIGMACSTLVLPAICLL